MPTDIDWTAAAFKALGDPTRLRILRFVAGQCCEAALDDKGGVHPVEGPTVGEVCCTVTGEDRITSTISHHIKELRQAGLIHVERRGRFMLCAPNLEAIARLGRFLKTEGGDDDGRC